MIHVQTVFIMSALMCALSSVVAFAQARRVRDGSPLRLVGTSQAMVAVCSLIAVLHHEGAPQRFVSFGINFFWLASFTPLLIALLRHYGRVARVVPLLLVAGLLQLPNAAWSLWVDRPLARTVFVSACAAVYGMVILSLVLRHAERSRSVGENVLLWGMGAITVATLGRCVLFVLQPPPPGDWKIFMSAAAVIFFVTMTVTTMLNSYAFKMMSADRDQRELERVAMSDTLTGLLTRRAFMDHVGREELRARRQGGAPLSILLFDLDHFKSVNDRFGHDIGDKVLVRSAEAIGGSLRGTDVLARFGGEEFMALLPSADSEAARAVAERARLAVEALTFAGPREPERVTVSIGVATYRPDDSFEAVYRAADAALYMAKRAGRNRVQCDAPAAVEHDSDENLAACVI